MPDRIIKESIKRSQTLDKLKPFEETCFYRLLVSCDDFGLFYRNPQILKSELFPRKTDLTVKTIDDAFVAIERESLIKSYWVGEEQYLMITTWSKYHRTREKKSKYPGPDGKFLTHVSDLPTFDGRCPRDADNIRQMSPNSNSNANTKADADRACAGDDHPAPFLSVEDAKATMDDHNEILNAADSVGMPKTDFNRSRLIDLYAKYGKEAVLHGIMEAGRLNKVSVGYVEGVAKNYGEPRPEEGKVYMSDEEEQSILKSVFW